MGNIFEKKNSDTGGNTSHRQDRDTCEVSPKPWRDYQDIKEWNENVEQKYIDDINKETDYKVRLLFLGPVNAGKSSFINSVASIDKGRMSQLVAAGSEGASVTKKLKVYQPKKRIKKIELVDTMGIEDHNEQGICIDDVLPILKGQVKHNYEFNPTTGIGGSRSKLVLDDPVKEDQTCSVVLFLDSHVVFNGTVTDDSKKKIQTMKAKVKDNDVPIMIVLTKVDKICHEVAKDITKLFCSMNVKKAVIKASDVFGVPESYIFPVKNYSSEGELDTRLNIPILLALRQMAYFATDYLDIERNSPVEPSSNGKK